MLRIPSTLMAAVVCDVVLAICTFGLGNVEWGGREPHLAVVNPVCGNEPGAVLDLGGEWTFATCGFAADRSQFFNMRQLKETWKGSCRMWIFSCMISSMPTGKCIFSRLAFIMI